MCSKTKVLSPAAKGKIASSNPSTSSTDKLCKSRQNQNNEREEIKFAAAFIDWGRRMKIQLLLVVMSATVAFGVGCWSRLVFSSVKEKPKSVHSSEEMGLTFPCEIDSAKREAFQKINRSGTEFELNKHRDCLRRVEASAAIGISTGDVAHWEALVHPAMISHEEPHRVGILGKDVETRHIVERLHIVNEVLKHDSVQEISMFGLSESGREYESCGTVSRDDVSVTCSSDGIGWFTENFLYENTTEIDIIENDTSNNTGSKVEFNRKFDVIIINNVEEIDGFSDIGHMASSFLQSLLNGLSDSGVLALTLHGSIRQVVNLLDETGFSSIQVYQEVSDMSYFDGRLQCSF